MESSASGSSSNSNGGEKSAPAPAPMPAANAPPPFLVKTYEMVDDPSTDKIVSWSPTNNSFVVWDSAEFGRDLLPKYFKHNNFSSFVRQLNTYGFRKVDPDRWEFANEGFLRGQKHLLKTISRRKPAHGQPQQQQQQQQQQPPNGQSSAVGACVEVGKFGLEEEVERLKRDKNVLMQELVRLRQQQQTTDGQLQTMVKRLQGMEQRQQQMMSFLAKAVNSPGFLAQFMQQPTDSNRRLTEGSKKRRLKQDDDSVGPSDSQIVKYQPLMNEAAQSMLRQIIKLGSSPVLENFGNQSDSFLIGDSLSAPTTIDCGSSLNRVSSVTLQEVPMASAPSFITSGSSEMISEVKSQPLGPTSDVATNQFSEMPPMSVSLTDAIMPELSEMPPMSVPLTDAIMPELSEMVSESNVDIMGSESESNGFLDPASLTASDKIPIEIDKFPLEIGGFSPDPSIEWDDSLLDGIQGLPGGADNFWEKFFDIASPIETDMDSTLTDNPLEGTETNPPENGWDKSQHMAELTEQMGLLTSEAKKV